MGTHWHLVRNRADARRGGLPVAGKIFMTTTFADFGLSAQLLEALSKTNLQVPTPIQAQAIPHIMQGRDLMGLAQTGTGKTAAFGLPLLHRILDIGHPPGPRNVRALILAPTRELAAQIKDNLEVFTKGTAVRVLMVVGGASLGSSPRH